MEYKESKILILYEGNHQHLTQYIFFMQHWLYMQKCRPVGE